MQREIQVALNGNERGKARKALTYLHDCWVTQALGERPRERLDADRHRMSEAGYLDALARLEDQQRACQAIDGASWAQWVPLLRRSLAEGDADASARLVLALGKRFDPAAEPEIVAGLGRDAWACDDLAFIMLRPMARNRPQLIGPNPAGAVNALDRAQISGYAQEHPTDALAPPVGRVEIAARRGPHRGRTAGGGQAGPLPRQAGALVTRLAAQRQTALSPGADLG